MLLYENIHTHGFNDDGIDKAKALPPASVGSGACSVPPASLDSRSCVPPASVGSGLVQPASVHSRGSVRLCIDDDNIFGQSRYGDSSKIGQSHRSATRIGGLRWSFILGCPQQSFKIIAAISLTPPLHPPPRPPTTRLPERNTLVK